MDRIRFVWFKSFCAVCFVQSFFGLFCSFQKAISQSPDCGESHFLLGRLYWDMGEATRRDRSKAYTHLIKVRLIGHEITTAVHLMEAFELCHILGCKAGARRWPGLPLPRPLLPGGGVRPRAGARLLQESF